MAKYLLTDGKVVVNNVNLSLRAFSLDTPSEKEQVDVSSFSPTNASDFLPGKMDQTMTIGFLQDFGTGSVHATLYPLFTSGSAFPLFVQPDSDAGTSATNPIFGGTASLYTYNGLSGELNDRGEVEAVFKPAAGSTFTWGTVAP